MKRLSLLSSVGSFVACAPLAAFAHTNERGVLLTLPVTGYYWAAGIAVLLAALAAAFGTWVPNFSARALFTRKQLVPKGAPSVLSFLLMLVLLVIGLLGTRDPLSNPLPLMVWSGIWVILTLVVVMVGDVWRDLNPWTGPVRLFRGALGLKSKIGLSRLGVWPAVLGYFGFAWFEIISLYPDDPAHLAGVVTIYWLLIFSLAILEGEEWLAKGEFLSVFFAFVARISPFWARYENDRVTVMGGWPGAQVMSMARLSLGEVAFITLALASVSFDGLHETFLWIGQNGYVPMTYPGRGAFTEINTYGLIGMWAAMAVLILGVIWLSALIAGLGHRGFSAISGPLLLSFLPIATGYHLAHYVVSLLTQGQYVIAALMDPGRWGGLAYGDGDWITMGFLSQYGAVYAIWIVQFALILGAHLLAILLAEQIARRAGVRLPVAAQLPIAVMMVLYTCFGLWLLSTPAIG